MVLSGCNSRRRDDASTQTSASQEEEVSSSQEEAEPDEEELDEEEKESFSEEEEESSSSQASSSSTPASGQTGSGSQSAGQTSGNGNAGSSSSSSSKLTTSASTKYQDVTYVKKGGYTKTESFNNAIIKGSGILLKNKTFYGDVTIQSSAGSGGITLENVIIKGTLKVQGGSGTLKLEDCQIYAMTLDYKDAKVYATGKTDVSSVLVKRDASLQESEMNKDSDGFENITVSGSGNKLLLSLQGMTVDDVEIRTGAWVTVNKDARVKNFVAKAPTYVRGTGTVDELTASNNYVYYQYRPDQLSRTGNYRLPRKYDASNNYWNNDDDWSDWDDDDNDDDSDRPDVYIRAISDRTLYEGQTDKISLDTNAYSLTATSDNTAVASVSVNSDDGLVVTAEKAGKAEITVKGTRSGYHSDTTTFTVTVVSKGSAPVIQDVAGVPASWQNSSATISFRVSDDDLQSVTVNGTALSASGGIYRFTAEKNGDYQIVATDQKGNVAKQTVTVSKIDTTKPVISTP